MIELERHIEILLLHNDCVIVPQLGGFVAHHIDARFDETDNMFLPPLRTLGFNPKLQLNDSLLAQSYIEAYDISYPEAMRRINSDVNELKQRLENEGIYELHGIGTLTRNDNGFYEFAPYEAGILTPELYGLGGVELDVLHDVEVLPMKKKQLQPKEENEPTAQVISISVNTLRNALAAAAVILAIFVFSIPLTNGDSGDVRMSNIDTGMLLKLMPKQAVKGTPVILANPVAEQPVAEKPVAEKPIVEKPVVEKPVAEKPVAEKPVAEKPAPSVPRYVIVLASKVAVKNASIFVDQLQKEGYASSRIMHTKTGTKVVFGGFSSEAQAYQKLNSLRSGSERFAEAWVYKVEL